MKVPFPYQQIGADFLYRTKRGILADEMGIGKTLQGILAAIKAGEPTLIICPANLKINWAREIIDQDEDAEIRIVDPGYKVHDYATGTGSRWLIINYDVLSKYEREQLKAILPYNTLILDEAHSIKDNTSIRTKEALQLAEGVENIYLITGTPILNRPIELFPLLQIIGHPIAQNWYSYAYRFCGAYKRTVKKRVYNHITHKMELETRSFLEVKGESNIHILRRELQKVYIRRLKKDVLPQLPKKLPPVPVYVEMEEPWKTKYEEAWDNYIDYIQRIKDELIQELGSIASYNKKLQNLESSKHLVEISKLRQITSAAKIRKVAADVYQEVKRGNKVIVFTGYTYTLDQIKSLLVYNKIKLVTLNGTTKSDARQKAVDAFQQDDEVMVFIGNIKAAGVGITLTKAHKVFFIDSEWTPALNEQAEDRAHRMGQLFEVEIRYYLVKDSIDEDMEVAKEKKKGVINNVLGEGEIVDNGKQESIGKAIMRRSLERANNRYPQLEML